MGAGGVTTLKCANCPSRSGGRDRRGARSVTKKHYREVVTKEDVEKFWNIRPLVNTPTKGTKNFGMSKPTNSKKTETTSPIAKKSRPVKKVESARRAGWGFPRVILLHIYDGCRC